MYVKKEDDHDENDKNQDDLSEVQLICFFGFLDNTTRVLDRSMED